MEVMLILLGVFIGVILIIGVPTLSRRKSIIKKSFGTVGETILDGTRDQELINISKESQYTVHGLAASFSNEAARNALNEIKAKGLARVDEKDGVWIKGDASRGQLLKEDEILAEKISIRSKKIGIELIGS